MKRFGTFEFDAGTRRLTDDGRDVHLTPKAFDLLCVLIDAAPEVVPKRELFERLWPRQSISDATLAGLIKELRRAFEDKGRRERIIRTAHRVGYAFDAPLSGRDTVSQSRCMLVIDGQRSVLTDGENFVGRDPACRVWIDKATVSRLHARIEVNDRDTTLEDLGSKNGTRIGNAIIDGVSVLRDGDRIRFGGVRAVFRVSPPDHPTQTQLSIAEDR